MRLYYKFIILITFLGIEACQKQENYDLEVEVYINQLKTNEYDSYELPDFNSKHISKLLDFGNDTILITNFPLSGVSSTGMSECKLGMYVLWNIESIRRTISNNSKNLVARFPSQLPVIWLRDNPGGPIYDEIIHLEAVKIYYDWWHAKHIFKNKMEIDPLENTNYMWH